MDRDTEIELIVNGRTRLHSAGVPYKEIRDRYFQNEEVKSEYERLSRRDMGLLIKEAERKAKFLFITNNQYRMLDGFVKNMEFEDGTLIKVVDSEKSIYINTCGMDITIISPEVDTKLINRKFNYVFVDLDLNFGLTDMERLNGILEIKEDVFVYNCGLYINSSFDAEVLCEDLFAKYGGVEVLEEVAND